MNWFTVLTEQEFVLLLARRLVMSGEILKFHVLSLNFRFGGKKGLKIELEVGSRESQASQYPCGYSHFEVQPESYILTPFSILTSPPTWTVPPISIQSNYQPPPSSLTSSSGPPFTGPLLALIDLLLLTLPSNRNLPACPCLCSSAMNSGPYQHLAFNVP